MTAPVRAVVVHRNQPERCRETVALLRGQGVAVEVVIVDNGSDPAARAVIDSIAGARVIDAGGNAGFGGGANVGLRDWLADPDGGEWALVLPHDARPEPDCLRTMLDAVAGVATAGLVSAEYGGDEVPVVDPYLGAMTVPATRGTGWQRADFAHGTFLLLRRACIEQVGLFDESYFAYCEEADLAVRARGRGWDAGIVWGAVVHNPHQGSPGPVVDYLMVRNTVRLVRIHFGWHHAMFRLLLAAVGIGRSSPWYDARARALAVRDSLLGRTGPPPDSLVSR